MGGLWDRSWPGSLGRCSSSLLPALTLSRRGLGVGRRPSLCGVSPVLRHLLGTGSTLTPGHRLGHWVMRNGLCKVQELGGAGDGMCTWASPAQSLGSH